MSFSDSDVFLDSIAEVRHLIGDTDTDNPQLTDEEIAYELGVAGGTARAAAIGCIKSLKARYATMVDTTELDLSVRASQMYEHFKDLLDTFNNPFASGNSVIPYAGGISYADIDARNANTDRVQGIFARNGSVRDLYGGRRGWN